MEILFPFQTLGLKMHFLKTNKFRIIWSYWKIKAIFSVCGSSSYINLFKCVCLFLIFFTVTIIPDCVHVCIDVVGSHRAFYVKKSIYTCIYIFMYYVHVSAHAYVLHTHM